MSLSKAVPKHSDAFAAVAGQGHLDAAPSAGIVVELVGPSAAGKTTLANALAARLGVQGLEVVLASSARPAEMAASGRRPGSLAAAARRAWKVRKLLWWRDHARSGETARQLLALLPPTRRIWALRYRRYLSELDRRWKDLRGLDRIGILDQGYLTAIATLAALGERIDPAGMESALHLVPRPDVVVRLTAGRSLLGRRLEHRLATQGPLERLFELDVDSTLRQVEAFEALDVLMARHGIVSVPVDCSDRSKLPRAVDAISARLLAMQTAR